MFVMALLLLLFLNLCRIFDPTPYRNQFDVNGEGKNVKMEETKWIHNLRTDVFQKL